MRAGRDYRGHAIVQDFTCQPSPPFGFVCGARWEVLWCRTRSASICAQFGATWWELQSDLQLVAACVGLKGAWKKLCWELMLAATIAEHGDPLCPAWVCLVLGTLKPATACLGFVDLWEILESSQCEPRHTACVEKPLEGLGLTHEWYGFSGSYQCRGEQC